MSVLPKPTMIAIWSESKKEYVNIPFKTTWSDLFSTDNDFWYDKMIYDFGVKRWWIPKMESKTHDIRKTYLREALPHLDNDGLNKIIDSINNVLEIHRKEYKEHMAKAS